MFTRTANNVTPSATTALNSKVTELIQKGIDVIKLNIGEPDFDTPENIKQAAIDAIHQNFTRYTANEGILPLRKAICEKLKKDNGLTYRPNEVIVCTGAKQALLEAVMVLAGDGDEMIIPTPCWVSYEDMAKICGALPVTVPTISEGEQKYHLDLDAIEKAINPRTKVILICNPNNPTGVVYTKDELQKLVDLAIAHDLWIISDEIYEKLIYDGEKLVSTASLSEEAWKRTVTINGCSKAYAMTGWRVGYAAGPEAFIKKMNGLQSHITSNISTISQAAAVEALTGDQSSVEKMAEAFSRRRRVLLDRLNSMPGVSCYQALGAFYLLPDIGDTFGKKTADGKVIQDSFDFAEYLLEKAQIAVVPGAAFHAPRCVRIAYSNSLENIKTAMDRMEKALAELS